MNCFVQALWFTWNAWKRTHFLTENLNSEEVFLEAFRACRLLIIDRSVIQKNRCKVSKKTKITKKNYYYQVCPQQVNPDVCIVTVGTQPRPSANLLATILLPSNSLPGIYFFLRPTSDRWLFLSGTDSLLFSRLDWCDSGFWWCYYCSCWCWRSCWRQFGRGFETEIF